MTNIRKKEGAITMQPASIGETTRHNFPSAPLQRKTVQAGQMPKRPNHTTLSSPEGSHRNNSQAPHHHSQIEMVKSSA